MSKVLRNTLMAAGLVTVLGVTGCSLSIQSDPKPKSTVTASPTKSAPTPSAEAPSAKAQDKQSSKVVEVSEKDLTLASGSIAPLTAVKGRYIVADGYKYLDTLTVLELSSGEKVYFATDHGHPFGSSGSGMAIAADQYSRDLTGFGELVPVDGPMGLSAGKMLADLKGELG